MKPTIYLDIDETLVYSRSPLPDSILWQSKQWGSCYTIARPSSYDFIKELSKDYRIASVTQGVVGFQKEVLEKVGLLGYFEDIYGWGDIYRSTVLYPTQEEHWLLVDNMYAQDLYEKAKWLGVHMLVEDQFIHCDPFYGHEDNIKTLTDLLPEVHEKIGRQLENNKSS